MFKLQNPLKDMQITQLFGQNATTIYRNVGMAGHNGIDYHAPHGTPIYASHDGLAQYQVDTHGGHGVIVVSHDTYDYKGQQVHFKSVYWHMVDFLKEPQYKSPIADKTGFTPVKAGELIGFADNTGLSTGSHLHFALKPCVRENWGFRNTEQNNGYFGAIDPKPFMDNTPKPIFTKFMRRGQFGDDIMKMQAFFLRTGRMSPITRGFGNYGPLTQEAVKKYQIEKGIKHNNGVQVGPQTLQALNKDYDLQ